MYYLTRITFENIDDKSGRIKKTHEEYLVQADSVSDAEAKLTERFKDSMAESCSVSSVKESKILGVM